MTDKRRKIPEGVKFAVLTEAGYRCAVPTCRGILTLNIHHIVHVEEKGGNETSNLIALCPTCHALYHGGHIKKESIGIWKGMLVSLSQAFDKEAIDCLLFLEMLGVEGSPIISGDTVMKYSKLISSGLVKYQSSRRKEPLVGGDINEHIKFILDKGTLVGYTLALTQKGTSLVKAWREGNGEALKAAIGLAHTDG